MAVNEISGFLKYKDADGNINLLMPITTKDNVDGIDEIEAELVAHGKHIASTSNPHGVTAAQIGLGNVDNTSDVNKPVSTAQATAIAEAKKAGTDAQTNLSSHVNDKNNPHEVTLSQLGVNATATELNYMDGVTSNVQDQLNAKAASSHGTHVTFSNTAPTAAGTASVGSATTVSRSDHVHPAQTNVSGNAGSADKLNTNAGSVTQPVYFSNGIPVATTHTLGASVPADAKFTDTVYTLPSAGSSLGGVKSGGDVTISDGVITINDDSHAHVISNIDGLQDALDGKEMAGAAANALTDAKTYTDSEISSLINSAPTTLDTLGEIATAMQENADVVEALESAIGNKAAASDLTSHINDTTTHITSAERTNWNVAKTHADSAHAPSNAEKNQNAFSNVAVGDTTIAADSVTDTLTIIAGENVTITPNVENNTITIGATATGGGTVETDPTPTSGSSNPVSSGGVYTALSNKQDKLTFDSTPTSGSSNPVTSGGVYTEVNYAKVTARVAMPGSLKWDGVVGDREQLIIAEEPMGEGVTMRQAFVHVSDYVPEILALMMEGVPAEERILSALFSMSGEGAAEMQVQVADDMFIMSEGFLYVPTDGYSLEGFVFPKKGWYFMSVSVIMGDIEAPMMYVNGLQIQGLNFPDTSGGSDKYFEDVVETDFVGDTLTWDGDTTGLVSSNTITVTPADGMTITSTFYKLSNASPVSSDFINGCTLEIDYSAIGGTIESRVKSAEEIQAATTSDGFVCLDSVVCIIPTDNYVCTIEGSDFTFPESGVYIARTIYNGDALYANSFTIPNYNFTTTTTKTVIKTEHLPKALRFGEMTTETHGDTLTWDGNTEGLVNIDNMLYRVSDAVPTLDDIHRGFSMVGSHSDGSDPTTLEYSAEQASHYIVMADNGMIGFDGFVILTVPLTEGGVTYPSGVYLIKNESTYVSSLTINGYNGFVTTETKVVKIDPKYLPSGSGGGSGLPDVTTDDNGAFLRVVNGVWTAVTLPNAEEGLF